MAVPAMSGVAQEVIIRRAEIAKPARIAGEDFVLVVPYGSFRNSFSGSWLFRSSSQPLEFKYRPLPDTGVVVSYTAEARAEDGIGTGATPGWSQFVGYKQRPALVAEVTQTTSVEAALENQTRFDRDSNVEALRKTELVGRTTAVPGLTFSATAGQSEHNDFQNVIRDQTYVRLWAEQQIPGVPVKLTLAPYVAQESVRSLDDSERGIAGWDTAVALRIADPTTFSIGASQSQSRYASTGSESDWSTFYTQVEQTIVPGAAVKLRAGYERLDRDGLLMSDAVLLGAESSFSLTETITGGIQLRHRAIQFMREAGLALPETIFSLSLGGSF
jgi:hypothetical protein